MWVLLTVFVGIVVGELTYLYLLDTIPRFFRGPGLVGNAALYLEYHSILSTVSISLLIALLIVYGRTYVQTKANFVLGLNIVLLALLLQNLLTYPILRPFFPIAPGTSIFSPVADIFTIIAYAVFLYLSLE